MWKRRILSRAMHDGKDAIKEVPYSRMGGHLELYLNGRNYTVDFVHGVGPAKYVIERDRCFDEWHERVDDVQYSQILAALKMAVHDCYHRTVHAFAPSTAVYEIQFAPGRAPFGTGRRVFIEGRLGDIMREHLGGENVTFEYPVRVDGSAPQWVKMEASSITSLNPVA
jgi:hypothetical protein